MKYYIEYQLPPSKQILNTEVEAEDIDQAIARFRLKLGIDTKAKIVNISEKL